MAIEIHWDNPEKTIIRYDITGRWTWDDLRQAQINVFQMMDATDAAHVGTIAHFTEGKIALPPDTLAQLRQNVDFQGHPKAGLTVVVGAGFMLKNAFGMFRQAYVTFSGQPLDFSYADKLDEARQLIKAQQTP